MQRAPRQSVRVLVLRAAWLLTACAACADRGETAGPPAPRPGTVTLAWVTPHVAESAVRLTIQGPHVRNITAAQPGLLVFVRSAGTVHNVALFGTAASGALLRFDVADVRQAASYTIDILEVAASGGDLRPDLQPYRSWLEP